MADEQLMSVEFNLFFDEDGNLGPGGGLHLKVINIGKFDEKTLADTLSTGFKGVKAIREVSEITKMPAETPPVERGEPMPTTPAPSAVQPGNRPPGGATEPQCKKILAVCHRLDDKIVIKVIEGYPTVEWRLDADGYCIPDWDFLRSLTMRNASHIIERLERAES